MILKFTLSNFLIFLFSLIVSIHTQYLFSQQRGNLNGIILDKNTQNLLSNINVKIIGTNFATKSLNDGSFRFENIPVGIYELEFSSIEYKTYIETNVIITTGIERELIVELVGISTEEVLVTEDRFVKPSNVSTSFKSLSFEEIRRFPGGLEDIGRVIQSLPGISLTSDGRNDLIVRGGSPVENLFIVDGFEVFNINHFGSQGATGGPVSILNLDFVNKVNFLTGGFSAKYGDKLSSVVEIQQRNGNSDKFFGKINLSATGIGANFEGPVMKKQKSSWLFSIRRSYLDIIFNASGFSFVPEYTDLQFKTNFNLNQKNFLEFNFFGAIDKVRFNNNTEENIQNNLNILTNNQKSYSSGIAWKNILNKSSFINISVSHNLVNYFYSKRDQNFIETFRNHSKESELQLKADYSNKLKSNFFINLGISGKSINLNYDIDKDTDTLSVINPETGTYYILPDVKIKKNTRTYKASVYAETVYSFLNRFRLITGLRYDYFDYIDSKNYISPRTSLSITITPKLNINFAYGIFYQSPSNIWLAGNEKNKSLRNIRADHYIAGIEYYFDDKTRLTLEGYYKKYKFYPVSVNRPYLILANNSGFETQNSFGLEELISSGYGDAKGIELLIQKALSNNFYGALNISISDINYTALDGIKRKSDWNNKFIFNLNMGYKLGKTWEFSAKFRIAGGRPYTPINPNDGSINYNLYNSENLPVYHRLDIRAEKKFFFSKWSLITYIDIQNLYNRKNIFEYRWNSFKKEIEKNRNLGILPSIGISAEF